LSPCAEFSWRAAAGPEHAHFHKQHLRLATSSWGWPIRLAGPVLLSVSRGLRAFRGAVHCCARYRHARLGESGPFPGAGTLDYRLVHDDSESGILLRGKNRSRAATKKPGRGWAWDRRRPPRGRGRLSGHHFVKWDGSTNDRGFQRDPLRRLSVASPYIKKQPGNGRRLSHWPGGATQAEKKKNKGPQAAPARKHDSISRLVE